MSPFTEVALYHRHYALAKLHICQEHDLVAKDTLDSEEKHKMPRADELSIIKADLIFRN